MHLEQTSDPFALVLRCVVDVRPGLEASGVDAEECQLTNEGVGRDLERQSGERLIITRMTHGRLATLEMTLHGGHIHRGRKEIDDGVEHCLDALVLERSAAQHGNDETAHGSAANGVSDLLDRQVLAAEILLDQRFVVGDGGLDHVVTGFLHRLAVLFGHFGNLELLAE